MMQNFLGQVISTVLQAWKWFFTLLEGMGGASWFIATFLGLFTISRFTDLVLMQFLYSPTSIDATSTRLHAIGEKIHGD